MEFFFPPLLGPTVVCVSVCVFFSIQRIFVLYLYLGPLDRPLFHTSSFLEVGCVWFYFLFQEEQ